MAAEIARQVEDVHLNIKRLLALEEKCIWRNGSSTLSEFSASAQGLIEETGRILAQFNAQEIDIHWRNFRQIIAPVRSKQEASEDDPGLRRCLEEIREICRKYHSPLPDKESWEPILKSALRRSGMPESHALRAVEALLAMDAPTRKLMIDGLKNQHNGTSDFPQTYVIRTALGQLQLLMLEFPADFDEWIQNNQELSEQVLTQIANKKWN